MTNEPTPDPIPVAPEDEPAQVFPSATGLVVPNEDIDPDSPGASILGLTDGDDVEPNEPG